MKRHFRKRLAVLAVCLALARAIGGAEEYLNEKGPSDEPQGPIFRAWEECLKKNEEDIARLLDGVQTIAEKNSEKGIDYFLVNVQAEGGVVYYSKWPDGVGRDVKVIVSPLVRIRGIPYSLQVLESQAAAKDAPHIETEIVSHPKEALVVWSKRRPYTAGSMFSNALSLFLGEQAIVKEFSQLETVRIKLTPTGALSNQFHAWTYVVEFISLDTSRLPVFGTRYTCYGISGLREAIDADGRRIPPNGRIIRSDINEWLPHIGMDKSGGFIWKR